MVIINADMTTKTLFIDDSHWEGVIDWDVACGYTAAAIHKSTDGIYGVDDQYRNNKSGCQHTHLSWAQFHFFQPYQDLVQQADHNVDVTGDGCNIYVIDAEKALLGSIAVGKKTAKPAIVSSARGLAVYSEEQLEAIDKLVAKVLRDTGATAYWQLMQPCMNRIEYRTGKIPWVYSSPAFIRSVIKPPSNWIRYLLWLAHYGVVNPDIPLPWTTIVAHQDRTDLRIPGIDAAVDGNWFYGSNAELVNTFGNGWLVPNPPDPPALPEYVVVNNPAGVNLRITSSKTGAIIVTIPNGKRLHVVGSELDEDGKTRLKVDGFVAEWLTKPG